MIARELELNNWTIKSLNDTIEAIEFGLEEQPARRFSIEFEKSGSVRFKSRAVDRSSFSGRPIPKVHSEMLSRYMLDIATLDNSFFQDLQAAYDALAQVQHIRESLISMILKEDPDLPDMLEGFLEYARDELSESQPALSCLYKTCTGNDLRDHRLR